MIEIKITLEGNKGPAELDAKMQVLGFGRPTTAVTPEMKVQAVKLITDMLDDTPAAEEQPDETPAPEPEAAAPAPKKSRGRPKKEAEPEKPVENTDDAAQDAADEAAEDAAKSDGTLTLDDLRKVAGAYQKKFGMAAAVKDVPHIIGSAIADVPEDQIADAIHAVQKVIDGEATFSPPAAKTEEPKPEVIDAAPAPTATKQDVIEAMMAYAKKFDGPDASPMDPATIPFTNEDAPKVFTMLFGPGITKLSHIPDTPENWGKVLAGLVEMTEKDPFGRGSK